MPPLLVLPVQVCPHTGRSNKSYVGTFCCAIFIENYDNQDSCGYRAGACFSVSNSIYVGGVSSMKNTLTAQAI
jgi:hypothetical protein